jgi:glycosyltransferase involved in cell wall biosynthesis
MKKISVVIPAYNEEKNIALCISSLIGQMKEDKTEIIVVNDGSTDNTSKILKMFSEYAKVISHRRKMGLANARNTGGFAAEGKIVAFVDADSIAGPNWLKCIKKDMKNKVGMTGPLKPLFEELITDHVALDTFSALSFMSMKTRPIVSGCNLAVRKNAFEKIDGFKPLKSLEDIDFGLRLSKIGKIGFSNKMIVYTSLRRMKASKLATFEYLSNYLRIMTKKPTKGLKDIR